jgi:hypothetical protein
MFQKLDMMHQSGKEQRIFVVSSSYIRRMFTSPPLPPQGIFGRNSFGICGLHGVSACPYNILKKLRLNITKHITYWKDYEAIRAEANRRSPAMTPGFFSSLLL